MPAVAAACLGALAGATVLYGFASVAGPQVARAVASLPGLDPDDLERVKAQLRADGLVAIARAPLSGMPVKAYIVEAARLKLPLPGVLAAVAVNRVTRIGAVGLASAFVGRRFAGPLSGRGRRRRLLVVYGAVWSGYYARYLATR